ncbi:hypothetical protein [Nocardia crassostreae]|uniref:hypothetical protein n=1 Tax=Nocardia crassostreae TaxID=53428 RepID=UPI000834717E|nr:hypothetical protein [Nocardia crassostreae]
MNANDNTAIRPRWREVATPAQIHVFRAVWALGALILAPSLLLLIGGLTANSAAGESGQVPGVLGLIGLAIGGTVVLAGLLVRYSVMSLAGLLLRRDIGQPDAPR